MFPTIQERLDILRQTRSAVEEGSITFDPERDNFGFRRLKELFESSLFHIKGFPCTAFNSFPDQVRFGIKVVPLLKPWAVEKHPALLEGIFLKEFKSVVDANMSPHIAYCFSTLLVPNNKKAMCRFPLKGLRREIHNVSQVLFTEFVEGGAVESWLEEDDCLTLEQWRYIIFAVVWTLVVLENKYLFMHTDTHLGNVLLDVNIDDDNSSFYQYVLKENGKEYVFNVRNVGILPKLWDFEHSDVYDLEALPVAYKNRVWENDDGTLTEDDVPHDFRPHYDLHFFLMSILQVDNLPTEVADLILGTYDDKVIPSHVAESFQSPTSDGECPEGCTHEYSESVTSDSMEESTDADSDSDMSDVYYDTDETFSVGGESDRNSQRGDEEEREEERHCETCTCPEANWEDDPNGNEESSQNSENEGDVEEGRSKTSSTSEYKSSRRRTDYLLGSRLLNGVEKIVHLPTPREFLQHSFFDVYRTPLNKIKNKKKIVQVFSYEMKDRPANAGQNDEIYNISKRAKDACLEDDGREKEKA